MSRSSQSIPVERVQTGVRLEKRILKVLKALADLKDITLGDLIEGLALHAFEGKAPFGDETLKQVRALKKAFNLDLDAASSHRLKESEAD
jgi:ABC-type transporter Mla subunit MlaD